MITFVSLPFYATLFFIVIGISVIAAAVNVWNDPDRNGGGLGNVYGRLLLILLALYIGLRPISGLYFGDTANYARTFEIMSIDGKISTGKDLLWQNMMLFMTEITDIHGFFLVCSLLYLIPLYLASHYLFGTRWYLAFLFFLAAYSFWPYATNGVRNGVAGSFFILAISCRDWKYRAPLLCASVGFHMSMLLPLVGYILSTINNRPNWALLFWLTSIPLSLVGGGFFESFFARFDAIDDRVGYLIDENYLHQMAYTGFRWDFLIYSCLGVGAGWYYIFNCKYLDKTYLILYNTFLFSNAFWILVIRSSFTNRFAYLSWFLMPLVVAYPLLKHRFTQNQHQFTANILMGYSAVTFFLVFGYEITKIYIR